jgi:hypothetical protein
MEFELKNVETIGGVSTKDENNSTQMLNITVGVVGCTYEDIKSTNMVEYEFANSLTVTQAKDGIQTFATSWVATNYPKI